MFGIELQDIDGLAFIKSDTRGPGFNFRLKRHMRINLERFKQFEFDLEGSHYTGKIYVPLGPPPLLGTHIS